MHALIALALVLALPSPADAAELDPAACAKLRTRLHTIDARARQRSTPSLSEQRREVKKRLYALRCSQIRKAGDP